MEADSEAALNRVTGAVVDAAMKVHSVLGPGLLESAYEGCLVHELNERGFPLRRQMALPVGYDGVRIDVGYRVDLLVAGQVIVELKAVDKLTDLHRSQLMTYLRLSRKPVGLLLNFNVRHMRHGIRRIRI